MKEQPSLGVFQAMLAEAISATRKDGQRRFLVLEGKLVVVATGAEPPRASVRIEKVAGLGVKVNPLHEPGCGWPRGGKDCRCPILGDGFAASIRDGGDVLVFPEDAH